MKNRLVLAVAGGRKTQGIIDNCIRAGASKRILILTFTVANQNVVNERLVTADTSEFQIDVMGWYSFVLNQIIRPFLPFRFRGKRIRGFDFDSPYQQGVEIGDWRRYVNVDQDIRKVHAAHLAHQIIEASNSDVILWLEKVYDIIFIDEVQDLCGYDLELLTSILKSSVEVVMVGDTRQAILATNPEEKKNKQYKLMKIREWFNKLETEGLIEVFHHSRTWRCRPEISKFADALFSDEWGFGATESLNSHLSGHDGIFLISTQNVETYVSIYKPLILRSGAGSGKEWDHLSPQNFGAVKGVESERVLIIPTKAIKTFLQNGKSLEDGQAARLYVAVTRAKQSVTFILDDQNECEFTYWEPAK